MEEQRQPGRPEGARGSKGIQWRNSGSLGGPGGGFGGPGHRGPGCLRGPCRPVGGAVQESAPRPLKDTAHCAYARGGANGRGGARPCRGVAQGRGSSPVVGGASRAVGVTGPRCRAAVGGALRERRRRNPEAAAGSGRFRAVPAGPEPHSRSRRRIPTPPAPGSRSPTVRVPADSVRSRPRAWRAAGS